MKNVILIGAGCSRDNAEYLCSLGVPVLTTWQGIDLVPEDSPVFCGRPGVIGQRAANYIQQHADRVYIFGARMDGEQVAHRMDNFAPQAQKYIYEIDKAEIDKLPVTWFAHWVDLSRPLHVEIEADENWLKFCKTVYKEYRPELDGDGSISDHIDPYYFVHKLSEYCQEGEIIVPSSSGMQSCAMMQAFKVKQGQRIILANTTGAMGFEPMAIGAAIATGQRVVSIAGDGGFFMNMQELEVVKRERLPIKYFVFCNGGYGSIVSMQENRFAQRVGGDAESGFTLPDLARVAGVWGIPYQEINSNAQMYRIKTVLDADGPVIVRVNSSLEFRYACKVEATLKDGVFVVDDMADMSPKI